MQRKIALAFSAVALGAVSVLGSAPAAGAAESTDAGVLAGSLTLYQHDSYGGNHKAFTATNRDFSKVNWSGKTSKVNNGASSMKNTTTRYIDLWDTGQGGDGCSGARYVLAPSSNDSDFSNNGFDNKASCAVFK